MRITFAKAVEHPAAPITSFILPTPARTQRFRRSQAFFITLTLLPARQRQCYREDSDSTGPRMNPNPLGSTAVVGPEAKLARGFGFNWSPDDHHLLQVAYNLETS